MKDYARRVLDLAIFENFFDVTKLKKKEEKRKNWKLAPACLLTKPSWLFAPPVRFLFIIIDLTYY